jgi:hypothetical protein
MMEHAAGVITGYEHTAFIRGDKPHEGIEQSAFPGAVWPKYAEELPFMDDKVDSLKRHGKTGPEKSGLISFKYPLNLDSRYFFHLYFLR